LSLFSPRGLKRKKAINQNLKSNFQSGTDCLETFLIAYLVLLSGIHFQTVDIMIEAVKHDELLRIDVLKDISNARFAFYSYIKGQILQEKMSNLHRENTTFAREIDKASENDALKHVEIRTKKHELIHPRWSQISLVM